MSGSLSRRGFVLGTLGAALLVPTGAFAQTPPFDLVRKRLGTRKPFEADVRLTRLGEVVKEWRGTRSLPAESWRFESKTHGVITVSSLSTEPGLALLAALIAPDPILALEKRFGGIRVDESVIEVRGDHFSYRYGKRVAVAVRRESWELEGVWIELESSRLEAQIDEVSGARRIRVLADGRPRWTLLAKPLP